MKFVPKNYLIGAARLLALSMLIPAASGVAGAHDAPPSEPSHAAAPLLHLIGLTQANEVQSAQAWSLKNRVEIGISGDKRIIRANGIPAHETGRFPNRGNPNTIREQNYVFRVDAAPPDAGPDRDS